ARWAWASCCSPAIRCSTGSTRWPTPAASARPISRATSRSRAWPSASASPTARPPRSGSASPRSRSRWRRSCCTTSSRRARTLAAIWMHHLISAGAHAAALLVNASAILLVSPVSWSHHWVWVAPALLLAVDVIVRRRAGGVPWRRFAWVTGALTVLFLIGPQWLLPHSDDLELDWAWWQQIIGSGYVIVAFAVLAVAACTYRPAAASSTASAAGAEKAASAAA